MIYLLSILFILIIIISWRLQQSFTKVSKNYKSGLKKVFAKKAPSRWIIGGMMGSGKSAFARSLSKALALPHIEIDKYSSAEQIMDYVAKEAGGWIAEANPWQIPVALAKEAEIIVFMDYDNVVNYVLLMIRGFQEWKLEKFTYTAFKQVIIHRTICELGKIVYLHGKSNREGWRGNGLFGDNKLFFSKTVRCSSPAELGALGLLVADRRLESDFG